MVIKDDAKIVNTVIVTEMLKFGLTINVHVVYMGRYEVVLRGDYP